MKIKTRVLALILCLALMLPLLAGCGVVKGDTVMEYEGYKITEAMYSYWTSKFKASFLYTYSEGSADTAAFWNNTLPNGKTHKAVFDEALNAYAKKVLVCMKLFDEYSLSVSDEIRAEIDGTVEELISLYGGKNELNSYLSGYGLNTKTLEKIYYEEAKVDIVIDYLFGENGPQAVTESKKETYYNQNYYCMNLIYIYTEYKPDTENAGTDGDSNFKMVELTPEEKAEKKALVETLKSRLDAGEDFAVLKANYCEHKNADGSSVFDFYPNGIPFSAEDYTNYGTELVKLVQGLEIGKYGTVSMDEYSVAIVKRLPLIAFSKLTASEYKVMVGFEERVLEELTEKYLAEITVDFDNEVASRYDVTKATPISMSI